MWSIFTHKKQILAVIKYLEENNKSILNSVVVEDLIDDPRSSRFSWIILTSHRHSQDVVSMSCFFCPSLSHMEGIMGDMKGLLGEDDTPSQGLSNDDLLFRELETSFPLDSAMFWDLVRFGRGFDSWTTGRAKFPTISWISPTNAVSSGHVHYINRFGSSYRVW